MAAATVVAGHSPPPGWLAAEGAGVLALAVVAARARVGLPTIAVAACAGCLLLGMGRGLADAHHPGPGTVDGHLGERVMIAGTVVAAGGATIPSGNAAALQQRFQLRAEELVGAGTPRALQGGIRVSAHGQAELWPGQRVRARGRLTPPRNVGHHGLADYAERLERQGVYAEMAATSVEVLSPPPRISFDRVISALRRQLVTATRSALPEPEATLVLGEVAGIRGTLPAEVDRELVDSGLVHVLAISGIKVAIVAGLLQLLAVSVAGRRAAGTAIGGIALYVAVGGASASALRSGLMGSLALIGRFLRRDVDVLRSLTLAAALMLGLRPSLAGDLSFQYSFLGVLGIALMGPAFEARSGWLPPPFREAFAVTIAAQIATLPLTAHYFQVIPLLGPVSNALVLPTLPLAIVGGMVLAALGGLAPVASQVAPVLTPIVTAASVAVAAMVFWLARAALVVAHAASLCPGGSIAVPTFGAAPSAAYYGALAAVSLGTTRGWPRPRWIALAAGSAVLPLILLGRPDGRLHATFPAGVAGVAVVVVAPDGATMLIDSGSAATALAPALDSALPMAAPLPGRPRTLDAALLSGSTRDEVGGVAALDRFRIRDVLVARGAEGAALARAVTQLEDRGSRITWLSPGEVIDWHGLQIRPFETGSPGQLGIELRHQAVRILLVSAGGGGPPPAIPAGASDVLGLGAGTTVPDADGADPRLVVVEDGGAKRPARGITATWGDAVWLTSKQGRLELSCDELSCR